MKKRIRKILITWFFKKPIRKYIINEISLKDEDFKGYLYDLLRKDE